MAEQLQWTDQQKRAITSRGSDVLVTASAGTGKTAVLSGRCVGIVADRSLCPDVSGILVLTFTEAAAEQMRSRIAERLKAAFLEGRQPHLRRQLALLQGADIGTIHSFCKRLITEHFHILGLDPTFGVLDADEAGLLKAEVLEKTIDWAWDQPNLVMGLEQLLSRRSLRTKDGFLTRIAELSNFLDTVISRRSWCERAALLAEAVDPVTSPLGQKQMQVVARSLNDIVARLRYAAGLYEAHVGDARWTEQFDDAFIAPVTACIELLEAGDWRACAEKIRSFHRPAFGTPKEPPETISKIIRKMVHKAYHSFDELSHLAVVNPDYLDRLGTPVSLQTRLLIELVKKFDRLYARAKHLLNCLDFADLEHHALKLLTDPESPQDTLAPSPTALALRQRYRYIFVDEYQDINSVQQAILNTLSAGDNLFVVGDVKQSIYAWRGAEPQIFLERLRLASVNPVDAAEGLRVDLTANFRSAGGILDFVNRVFSRIMKSLRLAGFDYDESARLTPATERQSADRRSGDKTPVVELHLLDEKAGGQDARGDHSDPGPDEELDVVTARRRQAVMIAWRIRRITGADTGRPEFQIYDKEHDAMRDVRYGDIVVLMRSLAKKANDYVEILRLAGVPVSCEATAGYFEATEISDILSLLKILDNPQRDIELAAVMRSPLFSVSDTDLAMIRLHGKADRPMNLYHCALRYCQSGLDAALAGKLKEALARLDGWRTTARRGNLADLIWRVYRETSYLSFVSALPNGRARRANLLRLHDRAIQFEGFAGSAVVPSLTRFVEFIEKLQEAGQDWAPAEPEAAAGNAVRILSIHKSKGLEFPVVFLAELGAMFNISDARSDCLADAEDTLGLQVIDRDSNSRLRSLAHEVIADGRLATSLAEEMRILYVATTRAKDRLILTASQKRLSCRQIISAGLFFGSDGIPDWQLRSCRS
ncbi:MAG: UvrD-helicase domain-containing protein, partial [Phycisphaerales bacterium]